jgi:hypothetical protein
MPWLLSKLQVLKAKVSRLSFRLGCLLSPCDVGWQCVVS